MRLIDGWTGLEAADLAAFRGATAALGNLDGVHLGHRALIGAASAAHRDAPLAVVTFEPHPRAYFRPDDPPFRLTTPAERARLLARLGVDATVTLAFDAELAGMEADRFVAEVLGEGLGLRHVAVGANFRFGRGRRGTPELLSTEAAKSGMGVTVLPLAGDGTPWSSSEIRNAVRAGDCAGAADALGHWHTVAGPVVRGDQRGRTLGYPTANLAFGIQIVPRFGVYAARVTVHDGPHAGLHDGVASIGARPTFGENIPNFEVHLFDFSGDLYGAEVSVALIAYLRDEVAFDGADALITQMDADSRAARNLLATTGDRPMRPVR